MKDREFEMVFEVDGIWEKLWYFNNGVSRFF
jgi:hypothetical protein